MTTSLRLSLAGVAATLLASLCLWPAFETAAWFGPTLFTVLVTVGACELSRRFAVTRPAAPLIGLGALVLALTMLFAHEPALWGFLPTLGVLDHAADLIRSAHHEITHNAAPVAADTGLTLLTAGGVGLVALAVDTLAVTLRRAALAGLPLLALYSVPAAVLPDGVGWLPFAIGAAGYLLLLLTEARERVTRWGRPLDRALGRTTGAQFSTSPLTAVGRRVGVAAVGLAVLVPVAAPGLDDGVLAGNGSAGVGTGNGGGRSTVQVLNPILNLKDDLQQNSEATVISYSTTDLTPGYLRLVSLDDFTGDQWQPRKLNVSRRQDVTDGLPTPVGLASGVEAKEVTSVLQIHDFDDRWLPLPFPARQVDIEGRWLYDVPTWNVFSSSTSTRQQKYTVRSLDVNPSREQLRDAPGVSTLDDDQLARFLQLPESFPDSVRGEAVEVTRDAETPYDQALALQQWLRVSGGFRYDESAPSGTGVTAIEAFLEQRRGFCVHFASTMAAMARSLGIPARVSVGFLGDRHRATEPNSYNVRASDAHAWPELYFEGVGWVPFEPTSPSRTGAAPEYATPEGSEIAPQGSRGSTASPTPVPTGTAGGSAVTDRRPGEDGALGGTVSGPSTGSTAGGVSWAVAAVGLVLVLAAVAPAAARAAVRRSRWRGATTPVAAAGAAWDELCDTATDFGYELRSSETPRQVAARLTHDASLGETAQGALGRLAQAVERARYAPSVGEVGNLKGDVGVIRDSLHTRATRSRRFRARVAPASTVSLLHRAGERVADLLDWVDRRASDARARLLPGRAG